MPVITLTSDWRSNDYYLASVKGRLLSAEKNLTLVDLNHSITPFNTSEASFILRNSYLHFPEGSIHMVFVNSQPTDRHPYVAIAYNRHFFIGTDNGLFNIFIPENEAEVVTLTPEEKDGFKSFPGLLTFTAAALDLVAGKKLSELGEVRKEYSSSVPIRPTIDEDILTGRVIYSDSYGNVITNISRELFNRLSNNRFFQISVQSRRYIIERIDEDYSSAQEGDLIAIFNLSGLLEIAIINGSASKLLNLNLNSLIRIEFLNKVRK